MVLLRELAALFTATWAIPASLAGIIACLVLMGLDIAYDPARIAVRVFMVASAFFMLRYAKQRAQR